jgi:CRP/FNR family transcriptional regulator
MAAPLLSAEVQGSAGRARFSERRNGVTIDAKGKVLGRYDKQYLLMFGEYLPFGETFPEPDPELTEAPAVVGEYACFERMPFPATCEFVTDGKIAMVPYELVYKNLGDEEFSLEIIKSLTSKIMVLSALIHKETIFSSEAKVAKMLIENSEIFSKLKYNEIASILNLTPETLSRIFKKMKKEKIIEVDSNHHVRICDPEALESVIESNKIKTCTNCIADFKKQMGMK